MAISNGWLSAEAGQFLNWWQLGADVQGNDSSALVEACVSAYAQTVAMCPGDHWRLKDNGGRERVTTSALSRILKKPNEYQSISDFMLEAVSDLYEEGNAYAVAFRNNRYEITELHLMRPRQSTARVAPDTGDVIYFLGGNDVVMSQIDRMDWPLAVPARDVLHLRLNTSDYNMLIGQSPLSAAAMDLAANNAMLRQQVQFYLNQARPSAVLTTDLELSKDQADALRDRWEQQSKGLNAGRTPILSNGIKPVVLSANAADSQLADMMKLTEQHIALVYRVPLQILGMGQGTYGTTESLMQAWISQGLGFALNHIEEAIGNLFELDGYPDEYVEFDTEALLRSSTKDRIESAARAVQGGIYSPNEARAQFGLAAVEFGDEPRVQQQVVPLSAAEGIPSAPPAPSSPAAPPAPKEQTNAAAYSEWAKHFISKSGLRDDISIG